MQGSRTYNWLLAREHMHKNTESREMASHKSFGKIKKLRIPIQPEESGLHFAISLPAF